MRHLYVHVPFCVRRCSYCDFSIAVRKRVPAREYVDAVVQELRLVGIPDPGSEVLETIYFGGGTPSLLPTDALMTLLTSLRDAFDVTSFRDVVEVTLEANPEDVTRDAATAWCRAGINRVSLDLIFALPAGLERDWARDLEQALALLPNHLSLYGLTVEDRTPLARWISRGAAAPPDDDRYAEEYLLAHSRLAACGYHFYEISNAARDGRRSRHNSAYWSGRPYRGLGPAAHSFDGAARRWNLSAWEAYRSAVAAGRSPVASQETLSDEQRELERVYLALRTDAGLPVAALSRPLPPSAALWVERGWAEIRSERLVCTPEGWLRLDALVRDLTGCGTTS
jgi:oxygen-independent coproporphyrinogen-3 oxidase